MQNYLPKYNIETHFVDTTNIDEIKNKINKKTKLIYCETMSNPLLEVSDIRSISKLAKAHKIKLIVDNNNNADIFKNNEQLG